MNTFSALGLLYTIIYSWYQSILYLLADADAVEDKYRQYVKST